MAKRVRHILTENARTVEAANALEQGDLKRMGRVDGGVSCLYAR